MTRAIRFQIRRIRTPILLAMMVFTTACATSPVWATRALASANLSNVALIQTVPLETTLAVPGIPSTYDAWLQLIRSAKSTLDIEQFYITSQGENTKNDPGLANILNAIADAAHRGVQIRVIVDSKFYKNYPQDPNQLAQIPGIQVRVIDFSPGVQHAKLMIVDQSQITLGSANFDWRALDHIHEIGIITQDATATSQLLSVFNADWAKALPVPGGSQPPQSGPQALSGARVIRSSGPGVRLTASPASRNPQGVGDTLSQMLALIDRAQKTLQLQTYDFSDKIYGSTASWSVLSDHLKAAANRGVLVQLIVDEVNVGPNRALLAALARLPRIEIKSVRIPPWSGGPIRYARLVHSKYMLFDGTLAWVGTENLTGSYFLNTRNVGLFFSDRIAVQNLSRVFAQVWNSSYGTLVH